MDNKLILENAQIKRVVKVYLNQNSDSVLDRISLSVVDDVRNYLEKKLGGELHDQNAYSESYFQERFRDLPSLSDFYNQQAGKKDYIKRHYETKDNIIKTLYDQMFTFRSELGKKTAMLWLLPMLDPAGKVDFKIISTMVDNYQLLGSYLKLVHDESLAGGYRWFKNIYLIQEQRLSKEMLSSLSYNSKTGCVERWDYFSVEKELQRLIYEEGPAKLLYIDKQFLEKNNYAEKIEDFGLIQKILDKLVEDKYLIEIKHDYNYDEQELRSVRYYFINPELQKGQENIALRYHYILQLRVLQQHFKTNIKYPLEQENDRVLDQLLKKIEEYENIKMERPDRVHVELLIEAALKYFHKAYNKTLAEYLAGDKYKEKLPQLHDTADQLMYEQLMVFIELHKQALNYQDYIFTGDDVTSIYRVFRTLINLRLTEIKGKATSESLHTTKLLDEMLNNKNPDIAKAVREKFKQNSMELPSINYEDIIQGKIKFEDIWLTQPKEYYLLNSDKETKDKIILPGSLVAKIGELAEIYEGLYFWTKDREFHSNPELKALMDFALCAIKVSLKKFLDELSMGDKKTTQYKLIEALSFLMNKKQNYLDTLQARQELERKLSNFNKFVARKVIFATFAVAGLTGFMEAIASARALIILLSVAGELIAGGFLAWVFGKLFKLGGLIDQLRAKYQAEQAQAEDKKISLPSAEKSRKQNNQRKPRERKDVKRASSSWVNAEIRKNTMASLPNYLTETVKTETKSLKELDPFTNPLEYVFFSVSKVNRLEELLKRVQRYTPAKIISIIARDFQSYNLSNGECHIPKVLITNSIFLRCLDQDLQDRLKFPRKLYEEQNYQELRDKISIRK